MIKIRHELGAIIAGALVAQKKKTAWIFFKNIH
jgi:hypothetical protein